MAVYWSRMMKKNTCHSCESRNPEKNKLVTRYLNKCGITILASMTIIGLLTSCSPTLDMQGHDPREYYSAHPIENKLEAKNFVQLVEFNERADILSSEKLDSLKSNLQQINPQAANFIQLRVSSVMQHKKQRISYIKEVLHGLGYNVVMQFTTTEDLQQNEVLIDIYYTAVVSPNCPDWRKSPVTTYSNTDPANFGCASITNLGLMVNNPHDLVYGTGTNTTNTQRSGKAISDYNAGVTTAPATTGQ